MKLTPHSTVRFEKQTTTQAVKKLSTFHGTQTKMDLQEIHVCLRLT